VSNRPSARRRRDLESSAPAVLLTTTNEDQGGWGVSEDNSALIPTATLQAVVICA